MKRFLFIILLLCSCAAAFAQAPADRSEVRSGNRDFRKKNYKEADIDYRRALVKDSTSLAANYNLANTLYRQENYQEAAKYAETAENTASETASPKCADVYFNRGDIALQNKDYNAAVEAFKRSLLLNPDDMDAKENYIYAKKMLQDQQQNGGGGNNDQNQDQNQNQDKDQNQNQDQNQDQNKDQEQNQNNDQNQNQDRDRQDGQEPQISPQTAQQMLQAIEAKEKETQDKVKKEKALQAKSRQREKNW